jgi:hypothetical protein
VPLQIGEPQAFAGPIGQRRDAVGAQSEQRRDLRGLLLLHVEVPQHELPPLRERCECRGGCALLELHLDGIHEPDHAIELSLVAGRAYALGRPGPVDVQAPDRAQQIGAEELVGTLAGLDGRHDPHERLGDQVIGIRS